MADPIACRLDALSVPERARRAELATSLRARVRSVVELANGYEYHADAGADILLEARELVSFEARCCPFLRFRLREDPATARIVMTVEGEPAAKRFIAENFGA